MERKLNIVYIGNKLAVHGRTPTSIDTLVPLFREEGHKVYFASSKLNMLLRMINMLIRIRQHRKTTDVVLIDTYSTTAFYYAWLCGLLCKKYGLKYVPILRGGNLPDRLLRSPKLCKQLLDNSYTNITVSPYLQEKIEASGYKTILIPNNIVLKRYPFKLRTALQPKLLWVRAFHKTYNPKMAIHVVDVLRKNFPDVQLTMVGPDLDGSMEQCKKLCAKLELHEQVKFTGKLSKKDWADLAAQCDIFINTTDYDNLPVSVIEAMALGLPVVSTNVGGVPYLIEHDMYGLLVKPGDVDAMNKAVQSLLKNIELTKRLSNNGRIRASEFDWSIIKNKWQQLFDSL